MRDAKWFRYIIDALVHTCSWLLISYATASLFSESSSRYAYGNVAGWWCSLYVGYVKKIDIKTSIPLLVIFVIVSLVDTIFNLGWFYGHDAPATSDLLTLNYLSALLVDYILFVSPVVVNSIVNNILSRYRSQL